MGLISLEEAIAEITRRCKEHGAWSFFFLVGAGISAPSVPLAAQITQECRAKALAGGSAKEPPSDRPIDAYSHWMAQAYPQPDERRDYLESLVKDKPISAANLRLAHLLGAGKVANLVVTPNFDDLLARALRLFGVPHVVCDHPATVRRIEATRSLVQVVHVHGSYWFYDCCNLKGEIEEQARVIRPFLDHELWDYSPLVVGYSGWEGDVIMQALRERLKHRVKAYFYWFCHTWGDYDALPDWLRSNPGVQFVCPPREPPRARLERPRPVEAREAVEAVWQLMLGLPGGEDRTLRLDATLVFDSLIRALDLPAPPLTVDPLGFFAGHLLRELGQEEPRERDLYHIHSVIERVQQASRAERQKQPEVKQQLEAVRDALRRADYERVIGVAREAGPTFWRGSQLQELAESLLLTASMCPDALRLSALELAVTLGRFLVEKNGTGRQLVALALLSKVLALGDLSRFEEAVKACDEVVLLGNTPEPELQKAVGLALLSKVVALGVLSRFEEAVKACDEVVLLGNTLEPELQEAVALALANKGILLTSLGRATEAVKVCEEVVSRFGKAAEPALQGAVAKALAGKVLALRKLGQGQRVATIRRILLERFGQTTDPSIQSLLQLALSDGGAVSPRDKDTT